MPHPCIGIADPANWTTSDTALPLTVFPVFAPNSAPLAGPPTLAAFTCQETGGAQTIAETIVITGDKINLEGAKITISSGYDATNDSLNFVAQNGITVASNAWGVLVLTGTATVADYQAAIRSIIYLNAFTTESTGARSFTITVTDGELTSDSVTRSFDFNLGEVETGTAGDDVLSTVLGPTNLWVARDLTK